MANHYYSDEDLARFPEIGKNVPDLAAKFDALMGPGGHGVPDWRVLVNPADWEAVRTVVDVGGGTGSLLAEILRARPNVKGTLVDLPRTVARSAEIFKAAGVTAPKTWGFNGSQPWTRCNA